VLTTDAETQLTLTPNLESSRAADLVSISSPALAMQYAANPGCGFLELEMLMTVPYPAISMS